MFPLFWEGILENHQGLLTLATWGELLAQEVVLPAWEVQSASGWTVLATWELVPPAWEVLLAWETALTAWELALPAWEL